MKYLNNIIDFIKGKEKKTVQDYIDIVNKQYNFKKISDDISSSLNRYDLSIDYKSYIVLTVYYTPKKIKKPIIINDRTKHLLKYAIALNVKFEYENGCDLNAENIFSKSKEYSMIDSRNGIEMWTQARGNIGNEHYNDIFESCMMVNANLAVIHIEIMFSKSEPKDIFLDSLSFLERKYGIELDTNRYYDNIGRLAELHYVKNINI